LSTPHSRPSLQPLNAVAAIECPPSSSSSPAAKCRHPPSVSRYRRHQSQFLPLLPHHLLVKVHRRIHQTAVAYCLIIVHCRHRQMPLLIANVTRLPVITPRCHRHPDLIVESVPPHCLVVVSLPLRWEQTGAVAKAAKWTAETNLMANSSSNYRSAGGLELSWEFTKWD